MPLTCDLTADLLWKLVPCLSSVSKDVEGELVPLGHEKEECPALDCVTLTTAHAMKAKLSGHTCDAGASRRLDGRFTVERLATVFEAADPKGRGVHAGDFRWFNRGLVIAGRLEGVTNAGTLRTPLSSACEECSHPGVMLGRLCGRVERCAFDPRLVGAVVTAVYRFEFDPTDEGGSGALRGVIEGAVLQECPREPNCIDFDRLQDGANPRTEQGHRIEVFDHTNSPKPTTEIRGWGAVTGLHLWFRTVIDLAAPASVVTLTLGRFATEGTVTAFDAAGVQVAQVLVAGPQNTPLTIPVTAPGIVRLEITCPQDEHLLQRLCVQP